MTVLLCLIAGFALCGVWFACCARFQVWLKKWPWAARWAVLCCAAVWCFGIVTQAMLTKQTFDRALFAELAASLVFSIGLGYAYQQTGLLALSMAAHGAERLLGNALVRGKL